MTEQNETTEIFNSNGEGEQTDFLNQLVGEGKKFNTAEELAKGKAEADRYIEQLKQELVTEKAKSTNSEETNQKLQVLMDKLAEPNRNTQLENDNRQAVGNTNSTDAQSLENLNVEEKVLEVLKERERKQLETTNVSKVRDELSKLYGEKAQEVLEGRAQQLGMSMTQINSLAASSPSALLELVTPKDLKETNTNFSSSVNSDALNTNSTDPNARGWSYYRDLKKKDPGAFWKAWPQMNADIEKVGGDKFYNM